MIDICFSKSTESLLKVFLNRIKKQPTRILNADMDPDIKKTFFTPSDRLLSLWFCLDQFAINDKDFAQGRVELLNHFYRKKSSAERRYELISNDIDYITNEAKNGCSIRIWYSDLGYSLCGLYYIVSLLQNTKAEIILVPFPENGRYKSWVDLNDYNIHKYLYSAHYSTKDEIKQYAAEWTRLCAENAELRVVENKSVISVSWDYFDGIICECVADEPIRFIDLLGKALGRIYDMGNYVLDGFVWDRIEEMIENGVFEIVGEYEPAQEFSDHYPNYILQKTRSVIK